MLNYSPSLDGVFHSLADPTRREIVERLTRKSASVKELAEPFDMSLPAVMLHLKILEASGIVTMSPKPLKCINNDLANMYHS